MKVGIDLTSLLYHRGVSRYTFDLCRSLAAVETVRLYPYASVGKRAQPQLHAELETLVASLPPSARASFQKNLRVQQNSPTVNHWWWHYWHVNSISKILPEIEVFHSWDFLQPPDKKIPLVSTIHDLAMLKYPETADRTVLQHHRESWKILRERRAHIIAVSESTRQDIIERLDFPADHVHRIYEALPSQSFVSPDKLSAERWSAFASAYGLTRPFILFVGTREPRKNLPHLIDAWEPLRRDYDLVIVGERGWDEVKVSYEQLHFLEHVDDEQLAGLYVHARALAYPSLDEGFGLPILESFAYGTPVVTSNCGAMKEVAGEAAVLVEPLDIASIRAGIELVLGEDKKAAAARKKRMTQRLQDFSWERTAFETLQVYEQAIKEFKDRYE